MKASDRPLGGRGAGGQSGVRDFVDGISSRQRRGYRYLEARAEAQGNKPFYLLPDADRRLDGSRGRQTPGVKT
jgi:hypothetical protein